MDGEHGGAGQVLDKEDIGTRNEKEQVSETQGTEDKGETGR